MKVGNFAKVCLMKKQKQKQPEVTDTTSRQTGCTHNSALRLHDNPFQQKTGR